MKVETKTITTCTLEPEERMICHSASKIISEILKALSDNDCNYIAVKSYKCSIGDLNVLEWVLEKMGYDTDWVMENNVEKI